ncbi:hypothetical protein G7Z17_g4321 [Cylindrodendrum hubeiense]|uniref:Uncharacterized protein n=1 Tax=Cylindrodendrum hubeiense TaxID=595255 RepID=A0A9P5HJC4_9HYPO|nr:hypothetical protein G7Z17_g4321 [Cylindrodendrum hubeiense]
MSTAVVAATVCSRTQSANPILYKSMYKFTNSSSEAVSANQYPSMDEQLDADIESILKCLHRTRDSMTNISYHRPIDTNELAELVFQARVISRNMKAIVNRHFDAKEEGIQLQRERELTALEQQKRGRINYFAKRVSISIKYSTESHLAMNGNRRDKRLQLLEDSMEKVDKHRLFILLAEGNMAPY